ncbi:MAG: isoprenylcysteine carboxylmethyltransferase family protein [Candidatus Thorarchaeota archaeon]|nr:MAG: isoprenylcysteine carboxylmethyltransferase family protein [Candidatus Thorarchaeota archaeon]
MVDLEEFKTKYPRFDIVLKGSRIVIVATVLSLLVVSPIYLFDLDRQLLVVILTYPPDLIPFPHNLTGLITLPFGLGLAAWANYILLHVGKIGLRDREPMQTPSTLVIVGPYRYSRNPIYLAVLLMIAGMVTVGSSLVAFLGLIAVYILFRYKFIRVEEMKLEEAFEEEYLDYRSRVRRWF